MKLNENNQFLVEMSFVINEIPSCPATIIEGLISLGIIIIIFLVAFPLTGLSLTQLFSNNNAKIYVIFKVTFVINVSMFWIGYVVLLYVYYYCLSNNVINDSNNINGYIVIILISIFLTILILQIGIIQIDSILRVYYICYKIIHASKVRYIILSIILVILSLISLEFTMTIYSVSHFKNYSKYRKYGIIPLIFGILFGFISHLLMLSEFINKIVSFSLLKHSNANNHDNVKPIPIASIKSQTTNQWHFTLSQNDNKTAPLISNETPINRDSINDKTFHDNIIASASKLITISLISYLFIFSIPLTFIILTILLNNDTIISLITGYILLVFSIIIVLKMYLHFSVADNIYYNKCKCCIKCDTFIRHILSKRAQFAKITKHTRDE